MTDPITGDSQAIDRPGYRVPDLLRWAAIVQYRSCTFPGCTRPVIDCEIDHRDPHPGGRSPTSPKGLAAGRTRADSLLPSYRQQIPEPSRWPRLDGPEDQTRTDPGEPPGADDLPPV